MMTIILPYF